MSALRSLLSWRSILYLDVDERWQLLRFLWRANGLWAVIRELLGPIRMSAWVFKERLRGRGGPSGALRINPATHDVPALSSGVPQVTCVMCEEPTATRRRHLVAEADRYATGAVRLAGGSTHVVEARPDVERQFEDFEDHNCFHRLYWAARLAGAHLAGHPTAGGMLARDLRAWLDTDWSTDRRYGFAYTTSERIINTTEVLQLLQRRPIEASEELIHRLKCLVWSDARHLEEHVEHRLGAHNHVVTNARALIYAARLLPEAPESTRWSNQAYQIWDSVWPEMVMPDGSFREGSSFYLLMNVRSILDFLKFSEEDGRPVSSDTGARLRRAVELADDLMRADGSYPRFGNISPDHIIGDLTDVLVVARRRRVLSQVRTSGHRASPRRPVVYADGGWGFLSAQSRQFEAVLHADPRADPQTHADAGKGSFELWYRGATLIRDPGNSTYALSDRHYFRSAAAQNVSTLDGIGIGISEEYARMLPPEYVGHTTAVLRSEGPAIVLSSGGWGRAWKDVRLNRSLQFVADGRLLLEESITGPVQSRRLVSRFHLGDTPCERISARAWLLGSPGARVRLDFELPTGVTARVEDGTYAPEYGVRLRGRVLVLEGSVSLPVTWTLHCEALDG